MDAVDQVMSAPRRNTITRDDAKMVAALAAVSGVLAALAGARPTGGAVPDAILCFALAAAVTWAGASTPWWALIVASGVAVVGSVSGPIIVTFVALAALVAAMWVGAQRSSLAALRAGIAAAVVQVSLRLELDNFFLASAIVAAVAMGLITITGLLRRQRYIRKRAWWALAAVASVAVLATIGAGAGAIRARSSVTTGYKELLNGLELLKSGDMPGAATALRDASAKLGSAADRLDGPLGQPSRLVPVIAQNRSAAVGLLGRAANAADAAAATLELVNLDQLKIVNGVIDVDSLARLEQPLSQLESTVVDLSAALDDANSPWLIGPFQDKVRHSRRRAEQVRRQAIGSSAAAKLGPAMLGSQGTRRYFFAFTNPAEARGLSGLMGNWSEVTITNGRIEVTASGRTGKLISELTAVEPVHIKASTEFFTRYGGYGAGHADTSVVPKFWSNSTMSPDMPSVASVMAQLYQTATGKTIDGVFIIDPAGVASLLGITGPITVPGLDTPLTSATVEQFLTLDQYQKAENEREDLLAAVTEETIKKVFGSSLPKPQVLLADLSPAALEGHISVWAGRPEEEAFLRQIGIDAAMPGVDANNASADGLAVVTNNANGNKIDSFLKRGLDYRPVYDAATGKVTATLKITLTNNAPTTGYPDYVIGNLLHLPTGTNRMLLSVYSRLGYTAATIDGQPAQMQQERELGWNVYSKFVNVPPGGSLAVTLILSGNVATGGYELVYRPQPLPRPDTLKLGVTSPAGSALVTFDGILKRRSVISAGGVEAWR